MTDLDPAALEAVEHAIWLTEHLREYWQGGSVGSTETEERLVRLRALLPDPSGIDPAGVSDGITREHPVIRVEPRERLVNGLVAWACLERYPPGASIVVPDWPENDLRWDLSEEMPGEWAKHRLAELFAETGDALDVRRAEVVVRYIREGRIARVQAAQLVGGFMPLAHLEGLVD